MEARVLEMAIEKLRQTNWAVAKNTAQFGMEVDKLFDRIENEYGPGNVPQKEAEKFIQEMDDIIRRNVNILARK